MGITAIGLGASRRRLGGRGAAARGEGRKEGRQEGGDGDVEN